MTKKMKLQKINEDISDLKDKIKELAQDRFDLLCPFGVGDIVRNDRNGFEYLVVKTQLGVSFDSMFFGEVTLRRIRKNGSIGRAKGSIDIMRASSILGDSKDGFIKDTGYSLVEKESDAVYLIKAMHGKRKVGYVTEYNEETNRISYSTAGFKEYSAVFTSKEADEILVNIGNNEEHYIHYKKEKAPVGFGKKAKDNVNENNRKDANTIDLNSFDTTNMLAN